MPMERVVENRSQRPHRVSDAREHTLPVAYRRLPEQAQSRIPGRIGAREHPAPVGTERYEHEARPAERTGEMRHRRVDRDDEIDERQHGGGVVKVIERVAYMGESRLARELLSICSAEVALDADEPGFEGEQRRDLAERHRAVVVI